MKLLSTILAAAAAVAILAAPAVSAELIYIPLGGDNAIVAIDPVEDAIVLWREGLDKAVPRVDIPRG